MDGWKTIINSNPNFSLFQNLCLTNINKLSIVTILLFSEANIKDLLNNILNMLEMVLSLSHIKFKLLIGVQHYGILA